MKKLTKIIIVILILIVVIEPARDSVLKLFYPDEYSFYIDKYSHKYDLDRYLVMGLISVESSYNPDAVSEKGAKGLMQITEDTAKWCIQKFDIDATLENYTEPKENIEIGCAYLNYLFERFEDNKKNTLAAYNAGMGNVEKWLNDPEYSKDKLTLSKIPFKETAEYVQKVEKREEIYKDLYEKKEQ
ncbi:MAG: lytic transglycosylase domain-containing protein [Ruminococcaceae bacterium]|nr:lytic transglycosylase domain-containing protein [Oscillospiraceae bacterium]